MKASASIIIDKPISEVWDFVSNIENMDKWVNGVRDPKPISEGEWGVGSTFEGGYEYAGKTHRITYEITGFDPPGRISMRSTSGPFPFEGWTELLEGKEGTQVVNTIDAKPTNRFLTVWFTLLGVILRMMMRIQLRKELTLLKVELEATESSRPG